MSPFCASGRAPVKFSLVTEKMAEEKVLICQSNAIPPSFLECCCALGSVQHFFRACFL